jgi:peptidoglycan/xylan/chitin deacetylase (PgdA/CDA1 family)
LRESEKSVRHPKYWIKDAVFGTLSLLESWQTAGFRAILLYHCVGVDLPSAVPLKLFRRQMAHLKSNYDVVPLRDFKNRENSNGSPGLVAVTLDDGTLDNYTQALPILEDLDLKATFFIVTGCIGGRYRATYYETPAMNKRQIRELSLRGHEIGAHTVHHLSLRGLAREHVVAEMRDSKRRLEDLVEHPITSFSYPFGHFDPQAWSCAREAGFLSATTTYEALVPRQNVDWWALPRIGVDSSVGMAQFRGKVSPALEAYERLRGRR